MRGTRPPGLRRALAPLGAMLAIGLTAGVLIGRDVVDHRSSGDAPRSATTASREPERAPSGAATHSTTSDGAAGERSAGGEGAAFRAVVAARTDYKFLLLQPDKATPIRWDPCTPIHVKVSLGPEVPDSEIIDIRDAFDTLGAAMGGVTFLYDGTTDVVPDTIDGSSAAGADIVVAFGVAGKGPRGSDLLSGWEAGRGGLAAVGVAGPDGRMVQRPTHGSVVIDVTKWRTMTRHDRTILYLHEFGHAIGLDHPADDHQIMSSGAYDLPLRYQPGDLAGLARLGVPAGCTE